MEKKLHPTLLFQAVDAPTELVPPSLWGTVSLAPNPESYPLWKGAPTCPLLQLNLVDLPFKPVTLGGVDLLTVFVPEVLAELSPQSCFIRTYRGGYPADPIKFETLALGYPLLCETDFASDPCSTTRLSVYLHGTSAAELTILGPHKLWPWDRNGVLNLVWSTKGGKNVVLKAHWQDL